MDLRTGRLYESAEAARAAGVQESDIARVFDVDGKNPQIEMLKTLDFKKHRPFAAIKNKALTQGDGDQVESLDEPMGISQE